MKNGNNYKEYLNSYAWKALKKVKLDENPDCEVCGSEATTVHHLSYERLGKEKEDDIVSVCESCHNDCHFVEGYQIKNDEKELRKRFEEISDSSNIANFNNEGTFIDGFLKIEKYPEPYYLLKNNELILPGNTTYDLEGLYQYSGDEIVYNFIDKKGNELFEHNFTSASDFNNNEADVILFGIEFVINTKGKIRAKNINEWNNDSGSNIKGIGLLQKKFKFGYCFNYIDTKGKILNKKWWIGTVLPLAGSGDGYYKSYTIVEFYNGYNMVNDKTGILFDNYEYENIKYISPTKMELTNKNGNKRVINKNGEDVNGFFKYF